MTPEDITKIITRRLDARIRELDIEFFDKKNATVKQLDDIHARTQECYHLKKELIRALKDNETKDNQVN